MLFAGVWGLLFILDELLWKGSSVEEVDTWLLIAMVDGFIARAAWANIGIVGAVVNRMTLPALFLLVLISSFFALDELQVNLARMLQGHKLGSQSFRLTFWAFVSFASLIAVLT